jgi:hypothetical protein
MVTPSLKNGNARPATRRSGKLDDGLASALTHLERALNEIPSGSARDWARKLEAELEAADDALRSHVTNAEGPDGLFIEIDQDRPTMLRLVEKLRDDHCRLMVQSAGLRNMVRAHAISSSEIGVLMGEFVTALKQHQQEEMDAVFDSINLDIGTGD